MDDEDRFARLCEIPEAYRKGAASMRDLVQASGYANLRDQFAARDLATYLRAHPEYVEHWVSYSEDKRASDGWYLRPPYSIGRITAEPPPMREARHVDLAAACAAFIIAELGDILDRATEHPG